MVGEEGNPGNQISLTYWQRKKVNQWNRALVSSCLLHSIQNTWKIRKSSRMLLEINCISTADTSFSTFFLSLLSASTGKTGEILVKRMGIASKCWDCRISGSCVFSEVRHPTSTVLNTAFLRQWLLWWEQQVSGHESTYNTIIAEQVVRQMF